MKLQPQARGSRGRPAGGSARLSREQIRKAAAKLVESMGASMSMRQLAAELGVDPMAIYHYFPNKDGVIEAVAAASFEKLDMLPARLEAEPSAQERLLLLAIEYLQCAALLPNLTRLMARGQHRQSAASISSTFDDLFLAATGLDPRQDSLATVARDVFVDYLHGFALSGQIPARENLMRGVHLIHAGIVGMADRSP